MMLKFPSDIFRHHQHICPLGKIIVKFDGKKESMNSIIPVYAQENIK